MRAVGLLSGGLDSTLAVKLIVDQGLEVSAIKFVMPFCPGEAEGHGYATAQARRLGIELKLMPTGDDYLAVVRHPRHGWGTAVNPCIDCRIFMLRKAKAYLDEIGAAFLFTGEVLGQRPMSQHRHALDLIAREAGLEGKLLRPLSAQLLPPTEAERQGWVDRTRLLAIEGRSRKTQIALARELGIKDYPGPAGGCLLADQRFAARLRDLFAHQAHVTMQAASLLKVGRHFRLAACKIVCGRNQAENKTLQQSRGANDLILESADAVGPTVLLQGAATEAAIQLAAAVAAAYADGDAPEATIHCQSPEKEWDIRVARPTRAALQGHYIGA